MKKENTIAIIIHKTNETACSKLLEDLSKLQVPDGFYVDVIMVEGNGKRAEAYNAGMRQSCAKYKLYIDEAVRIRKQNMLLAVVDVFNKNSEVGMIGLYGSEMPIDGDYTHSRKRYGLYAYKDLTGATAVQIGGNPLWIQKVHCLDGGFVATIVDIEWDEQVDDFFCTAAQCCRFREKEYVVAVPMQNNFWCVFDRLTSYVQDGDAHVDERKFFFERYKGIIQPLVSILITTYNQPVFFRQALESALHQDYENIEIVIGDDSTNTETRDLMKEYEAKYPNIRYYYHQGPLGGFGRENLKFVLNHCHGEYVNCLFHDDIFKSMKIRRMMEYYVQDLDEEIGMVTSSREIIDTDGNVICMLSFWQPFADTLLEANKLARGVLGSTLNYIGELTTVLFRKNVFKTDDGTFLMGSYYGHRDRAIGDVATFLECARQGKKCVFLRDVLSFFRTHSAQNTHNIEMRIDCILDWLNYITLSWVNHVFIRDVNELRHYYDVWGREMEKMLKALVEETENEKFDRLQYAIRAMEAVKQKDYEQAKNISLEYMEKY